MLSSVHVSVFDTIEQYAPGFKDSVIDRDILSPPDLERIFGLTGGVSGGTQTCPAEYAIVVG